MVLAPRPWRQVCESQFAGDGGKRGRSPGSMYRLRTLTPVGVQPQTQPTADFPRGGNNFRRHRRVNVGSRLGAKWFADLHCYLCGNPLEGEISPDHVPPQLFFSTEKQTHPSADQATAVGSSTTDFTWTRIEARVLLDSSPYISLELRYGHSLPIS